MIEISTLGNSEYFGDLSQQRRNPGGRVSDGTRGLILGGYHEPSARDNIDYCTIASGGDFIDFGNLTSARFAIASGAVSSSTRGVTAGGNNNPAYKKVQMFIANENGAPASNILHVRGSVAVPKIFPNSNRPTKLRSKPTITIEIKGQLFII